MNAIPTRHPLVLLLVAVLIALAAGSVRADTFNASWTPPIVRADGTTPMPASEIAGYRLEWTLSGVEQPDVTVPPGSSYTLTTATFGRACITLRTVDTADLESEPSAMVCRNIRPGKPVTIRVQ
jgi:hypothetical protein